MNKGPGIVALAPEHSLLQWIIASAVLFLALLGAMAASIGGTPLARSTLLVSLWGTLAMAGMAGVGMLFGAAP